MKLPFKVIEPTVSPVPILVSVPHCGVGFPDELVSHFKAELSINPDDTDFFVQGLYSFVSEMGITLIESIYNRWVIDLNRSPENENLYSDGRIITALTPTTNFLGDQIYCSTALEPDLEEVERRKNQYYFPYYNKVDELLNQLKEKFGNVLLWDAHSIRRVVPTIQKDPFVDMILGTNNQKSADAKLIRSALKNLKNSKFDVAHNFPFKGGNITRHFGNPVGNIHAIQLEMTKDLYMNDSELSYDQHRAVEVRLILKNTFNSLIKEMKQLPIA